MSLHLVYVLAGSDLYADMVYISATLARAVQPGVRITTLTNATSTPSSPSRLRALGACDDVVAIPIPEWAAEASRYLKTTMRRHLDGEFLFIDADTVPLREFGDVARFGGDIAAALDRCSKHAMGASPWTRPLYTRLGWPFPPKRYYNSGIIYFHDTARARRLAEDWHHRWRQSCGVGVVNDQPAFNAAIDADPLGIPELPLPYNAMIEASPYYARGARILHFFAHMTMKPGGRPDTLLDHLIAHLQRTGQIDQAAVDEARDRDFPYVACKGVRRNLMRGRYCSAALAAPGSAVRRMLRPLPFYKARLKRSLGI